MFNRIAFPEVQFRPLGRQRAKRTQRTSALACRRMFSSFFLLFAAIAWTVGLGPAVKAGEFNAVLSIGDQAPTWSGLEGTDGKQHGWDNVAGSKCIVVAFTCNSCPYARDVENRLIELTKEFPAPDMRLVAINVNVVKDDSLVAMKQRAEEKGFPYPYLHDPTQKIAKDFGAIKTPEFFVLDAVGKVVYMGSFDDSPDGKAITQRYVADAVRAVLAGTEPETEETVPIGCRVRYVAPRGGR